MVSLCKNLKFLIKSNLNLSRSYLFISSKLSTDSANNAHLDEDTWFKDLIKTPTTETESKKNKQLKFTELDPIKKREEILRIWESRKETGQSAPINISENDMKLLLKSESFTHLVKGINQLCKEEHFKKMKEQRKIDISKRERTGLEPGVSVITNYPGANCFMRRVGTNQERIFHRKKVFNSVFTNEPSIVFDFRYTSMHTRVERIKSLYRQFMKVIQMNRRDNIPFQLYFCNYDKNTEFNQLYGNILDYDDNLVFETEKSYTDIFPKQNLIYLSRDASNVMTKYDPDKVYIIGSIIDSGTDKFKYSSYSQAKKDGIRCERLPLDEYVNWKAGDKNLNMDHMFSIFLKLKEGQDWRNALNTSLPTRKFDKIKNFEDYKHEF